MIINKDFNIKIKGDKSICDLVHSALYEYMKNYCTGCDIEVIGEINQDRINGDAILFSGTYLYADFDTKPMDGSITVFTDTNNEIIISIHQMEHMRMYKANK